LRKELKGSVTYIYFLTEILLSRISWLMFATLQKKPDLGDGCVGKVNFVEIRTFWHLFRSFDRMWSFYILSLQVPEPLAFFEFFFVSLYKSWLIM